MARTEQRPAGGRARGDITALLDRWRGGEPDALESLAPLVYDELKKLARHYLRARPDAVTLQPTALVHELFVRLLDGPRVAISDRRHFFALAAKLLRQVLVDRARERGALKRGGGAVTVDLASVDPPAAAAPCVDLLDLERALGRLRAREPRAEQLVELRFFGGLTIEEAAAVLDRSEASVSRDWALARAFLFRELAPAAAGAPARP